MEKKRTQAKPPRPLPAVPGAVPDHPHSGQEENGEPRSLAGLRVSEERYWAEFYEDPDICYEWNDGTLEEKPLPDYEQVLLYGWFQQLLRCFLTVHPIAKLLYLEMGVRFQLPRKTAIRKPDLFVVRHDNPLPLGNNDRSYRGICDLCVESLSDSNKKEIERDTKQKKGEYEAAGVHEYYILDARGAYTTFLQRTPRGVYVPIIPDQGVIRSTSLPGFQFRIIDLYHQPSLLALSADEVYQGFVLPEYQQEKARADLEKARADRLAAKLRELGIDETTL